MRNVAERMAAMAPGLSPENGEERIIRRRREVMVSMGIVIATTIILIVKRTHGVQQTAHSVVCLGRLAVQFQSTAEQLRLNEFKDLKSNWGIWHYKNECGAHEK